MNTTLIKFKKKLEPIGEKIGYKTIRYGYKGIPYVITYIKNRNKIKQLYNMVEDEESKKVIHCLLLANMTRNKKKWASKVCNEDHFVTTKIGGEIFRYHPHHYFEPGIIKLSEDEVFVDAGGFAGDTTLNFIKQADDKFKKIHIFEASPNISKKLISNLNDYQINLNKIIVHNKGLYSSTIEAFFEENMASSMVSKKGNIKVELVDMDHYLSSIENDEVTFVKMDIEGAEMDALQGMQEMIKKNKPKLAISIYHLKDDLWKIPFFIKNLNPKYKLYIRQYGYLSETVCYAIP